MRCFLMGKIKVKENKMEKELFKNYKDVVGIEQLQEMLSIGRTYAYKLLKQNKIKNLKIGREYKIAKIHVIEYLENNVRGEF